jgi:hypothetical protein
LLNYGHEIEFLELLNRKSKIFINTKSDTEWTTSYPWVDVVD